MKKVAALLLVLIAAAVLTACGSSNDETSSAPAETTAAESGGSGGEAGGGGGAAQTLAFEAAQGTELAYTSDSAQAEAGKVEIEFTNPQSIGHDVAIEDSSGEEIASTEVVSNGKATASAELEPGSYTFFCSIPGHREAGMEGTLTVK